MPQLAHENTCESFEKAVVFGADMIEFDVRRTQDGTLVAFHDNSIVVDNKIILINSITFSNLQNIASRKQYAVPTIQEIFEQFAGRIGFDIEFKEEDCEEETIMFASKYKCINDCIITSFNLSVIKKIQSMLPETSAGLLVNKREQLLNNDINSLAMLCPSKDLFLSNRSFFADWKQTIKLIAVWTVDETVLLKHMLQDNLISHIITNRSDKALKLRDQTV